MNEDENIGLAIKTLSHLMHRTLGEMVRLQSNSAPSAVQSHILGYFAHTQTTSMLQSELQHHLGIRRSTMTNILSSMEREGLVERRESEQDKRQKAIFLTEKANRLCEEHLAIIGLFESRLREGLSEQEIQQFFLTIKKLQRNLEPNT